MPCSPGPAKLLTSEAAQRSKYVISDKLTRFPFSTAAERCHAAWKSQRDGAVQTLVPGIKFGIPRRWYTGRKLEKHSRASADVDAKLEWRLYRQLQGPQ